MGCGVRPPQGLGEPTVGESYVGESYVGESYVGKRASGWKIMEPMFD